MVRYRYSASGNYTLRLKVGANVTTYSPAIADVYSTEVQVLGLWFGGFYFILQFTGHNSFIFNYD